ncbi:isochorismatase family protein [Capillimicrobium parvum]|uniref:N-carbamoylsarcosine amidase n=1 Tax=Capillimicrobium parvum TaxID=2884022 RepID=A0A9E7C0T9_9ACTN|nr:isochorismatase family protein [Capillimicrobium parvum]UGS35969.1 N-carbamoylsarcosine amidase [Capillimicrobium parvum]
MTEDGKHNAETSPNDDAEAVSAMYDAAGIRRRLGFGERPAVVVVDLSKAFTSMTHPLGSDMEDVIVSTVELITVARDVAAPVFFTTIAYLDGAGPGTWGMKSPVLLSLVDGGPDVAIDDRLGRRPTEPLITKAGASAFFGTNLAAQLTHARVDTVLVAGGSTSGCVRATVVDAIQLGFRPIVPRQCVGDRADGPHRASLIDMDGKYADVLDLAAVIDWLRSPSASRSDHRPQPAA